MSAVRIAVAAAFLVVASAANAQVPAALVGLWSSDRQKCEESPQDGIVVLEVTPKELSYYEISCIIRSSRQIKDGARLSVACVKGGGIKGSGTIDLIQLDKRTLAMKTTGLRFQADGTETFYACPGPPKK